MLRKARAILDAFDARSGRLGLSELARRTGLAKTTVHRVAGEMVEVGLLVRHGSGYELGPLLFEFGERVPHTRTLRLAAAPYLEDLAASTGETVLLGVPGDHEVLFMEKYFGRRGGGRAATQVEGRVPLHCSASGKVFLAFGAADVTELAAGALRRCTAWTVTDPERLRSQVAGIRDRGYAIERQELETGYGAVAAPVLDGGQAVATLSVVAPIDRLAVRTLAPEVCAAARALSQDVTPAGRAGPTRPR